jgi:sigma-B regulation protein RsbU (phosphoserine phosphatase)
MDAAKEVGGDFYDFYLLDETHLAFVVADVSGKGIPGAMFMMTSKTLIKSHAESGLAVNDVFTQVNAELCENNEADMFAMISKCFAELCGAEVSDKLRSFIHYFED